MDLVDRVRDDYKAIRYVCFFDKPDPWEYGPSVPLLDATWEIYSLKSNCWKKLDVDTVDMTCYSSANERFYLEGTCHWFREGNDPDVYAYLVSFDLSNETFCLTLTPSDLYDNFDIHLVQKNLLLLNGSIALISNYESTFYISIFAELGVKESWTKLFIVGPVPCLDYVVGAGKRGDIFFRKKDGELASVDVSSHMVEEFGVKGDSLHYEIVIYKESLLPIGETNN